MEIFAFPRAERPSPGEVDSYVEHVLEKWRTPLQDVGDDRLRHAGISDPMADTVLEMSAMLGRGVMVFQFGINCNSKS